MKSPPVEDGVVVPHDHEEIDVKDRLIRRIDPQYHIVPDENRGCRRISSKALSPSSGAKDGMSVDIEKLVTADGVNAADFVTSPKHIGSVVFSAGAARAVNLMVGYDPITGNPYHGEVWGTNRPNRFSSTQQKALQSAIEWFVEIPGVELR